MRPRGRSQIYSAERRLYDLCDYVDRTGATTRSIAKHLGVSLRHATRDLAVLASIGLPIAFSAGGNASVHTQSALPHTFEKSKDRLDRVFGVRPYHRQSVLSGDEQELCLELYDRVLEGEDWPAGYFSERNHAVERLRVVLPRSLELLAEEGISQREVTARDFMRVGCTVPLQQVAEGSTHKLLRLSCPWLEEWECAIPQGYWIQAKRGAFRATRATRWLVEHIKGYDPLAAVHVLSMKDFIDYNLRDMLETRNMTPCDALLAAYPARRDEIHQEITKLVRAM